MLALQVFCELLWMLANIVQSLKVYFITDKQMGGGELKHIPGSGSTSEAKRKVAKKDKGNVRKMRSSNAESEEIIIKVTPCTAFANSHKPEMF